MIFILEAESTQSPSADGTIRSAEKFNDLTWNRTRDPPVFSRAPQLTAQQLQLYSVANLPLRLWQYIFHADINTDMLES
jgi:hypothetical protein